MENAYFMFLLSDGNCFYIFDYCQKYKIAMTDFIYFFKIYKNEFMSGSGDKFFKSFVSFVPLGCVFGIILFYLK